MARPREFDEGEVLDVIADLFWRRGFDAVSVRDIAEATDVRMASLYAAYGDKNGLYNAALEHYERAIVEPTIARVGARGTARRRIASLFDVAIDAVHDGDRRGCFLCNAAVDRAGEDEAATSFVSDALKRIEDAIAEAISDHPPYDKKPALRRRAAQRLLADYLGLRVMARSGAPVAVLKNIRNEALDGL